MIPKIYLYLYKLRFQNINLKKKIYSSKNIKQNHLSVCELLISLFFLRLSKQEIILEQQKSFYIHTFSVFLLLLFSLNSDTFCRGQIANKLFPLLCTQI